ncbi:MAG: indolepyruvate oxidoreductase [Desulfuromonas sp.]|uniref:thiamine pyrophosphate-dependent enzyme n=1 Tax=Desulfuromonas sp. TaxID=892 RepID=UPI000CB8F30F|nr:thiamine pyrophosphate-dependent enzyme [Desulfuromonas sp.]PLX82331.1 MAG: indolepyruvate oxidoreductase [Desulfuromonas sp.]
MNDNRNVKLLMGNEAIARGLIEAGCTLAAAYPGTPSTEVLSAVVGFLKKEPTGMYVEWSVNEKIAYEVALASSYTGKRSAVVMKQVGLNVAADPFMRSAYLGVKGGLVVIVADDPGPHSSQNEQDTRLFAHLAKVPVLDPSSPAEARDMVAEAFDLSEKYQVPVILRPTTRICHSRQNVAFEKTVDLGRKADFEKDPARWVATPAFLPALHRELNGKMAGIAAEESLRPALTPGDGTYPGRCVVASGIAYANAYDLLEGMGLLGKVDLYQVRCPFPLHEGFIGDMRSRYEQVLVLEETYSVVELQLAHPGAEGRASGAVPGFGELTPDLIGEALTRFLGLPAEGAGTASSPGRGKRPSLCAGCPHRAAFYSIKKSFPKGIFPSDIGCYTLGMNLGAVDTVHCMGACISQGAGFYHAYAQDGGEVPTVVVTIGDSTFFHAGIPALVNAVVQDARIIVVILDNATTAMTGHQPVPHMGLKADGSPTRAVPIPELVKACGVDYLAECDPYDTGRFEELLREADGYCRSPEGGPAVILSKHPCLMDKRATLDQERFEIEVLDSCIGCRKCIDQFECPAIEFDETSKKAVISADLCTGCGVCEPVCPVQAIVKRGGEGK